LVGIGRRIGRLGRGYRRRCEKGGRDSGSKKRHSRHGDISWLTVGERADGSARFTCETRCGFPDHRFVIAARGANRAVRTGA
jgi:hypothetical protein